MSKKDLREGEVISYIMAKMDSNFECETDFSDLPTMSRATAFRIFKGLDADAILSHVGDGKYRVLLPPRHMRDIDGLIKANLKAYLISCLHQSMMDDLHPFTRQEIERRVQMCASCDEEIREKCFRDEQDECPFQSQMRPVADETHISDPIQVGGSDQEEEVPVSNETELPPPGEDGPPEVPPDGPDCTRVQKRPNARELMKKGLMDSQRARAEKGPTVRQQLNEVKKVWFDGMKDRYGAGFKAAPWAGKEHKLVPVLLKTYGLELTKSGILLYLKSWDKIKAENAWIREDIPTVGLLHHFKDQVFAAVQGKGRIGERAAQRTADEWNDEDGKDNGAWPSRAPEAPPSA